jgi:hypothetical protein
MRLMTNGASDMNRWRIVAGVSISLCLVGCANVAPTQRGILSKPEMQFDIDRAGSAISGHTYASKESAQGGKAVGGGGCGCT